MDEVNLLISLINHTMTEINQTNVYVDDFDNRDRVSNPVSDKSPLEKVLSDENGECFDNEDEESALLKNVI